MAGFKQRRKMRDISETQAAYIAGVIDGEGSIGASVHAHVHKKTCYIKLQVSNTDKRLIDWLIETTGLGWIFILDRKSEKQLNWKPAWYWAVTIGGLRQLFPRISKYAVIKKDQISLCLQLIAIRDQRTLSSDEAELFAAKLKSLNRKGRKFQTDV